VAPTGRNYVKILGKIPLAHRDSSYSSDTPAPSTVLVVEDEVVIRMTVASQLRDNGFKVMEANDVAHAKSLLTANPDIALVFTDLKMPTPADGLGLIVWIRANRPDVSILMASASADIITPAQIIEYGVQILQKPYDMDMLADNINAHLVPIQAAQDVASLKRQASSF
jgi:DNA-binding response OmpR family regulator